MELSPLAVAELFLDKKEGSTDHGFLSLLKAISEVFEREHSDEGLAVLTHGKVDQMSVAMEAIFLRVYR